DHDLVAQPVAFEHDRVLIGDEQLAPEIPEHAEEARLVAVVALALGEFQLRDDVDTHDGSRSLQLSSPSYEDADGRDKPGHDDEPCPSECRRRAGADHFARLVADAAETMRAAALEIIGVAGGEDAALAVDGYFQPARDDDAAFLAVMHERHAAGVAAG